MKYQVYIQNNLVGTIDADNTGVALSVVSQKIENKEFILPDTRNQPQIKVVPLNE
jgi:hypothetical protein